MDISLKTIARIMGGEIKGNQVLAPGPGHSAKDRSLSITISNSGDDIIVHSFASDDTIECKKYVREKCGIQFKPSGNGSGKFSLDVMVRAAQSAAGYHKPKAKPVAVYHYTDRDGTLLYQVLRYDNPKRFGHRQPDGNGGWIYKGADKRVVYRWPELSNYPDATVFVCEGEKDADNVAALGNCATTVASGKWTDDCVNALAGRHCWILEDNDDAGRKKALEVAQKLHPVAASIKIARFPSLPNGGDVSDWLDMGRTKDDLEDFCSSTPDWTPDSPQPTPLPSAPDQNPTDAKPDSGPQKKEPSSKLELNALSYFSDLAEAKPKLWLIKNVIARGECSSWIGPPGKGKSALLADLSVHGAHAAAWRGYRIKENFGILYFAVERVDLVKRRMTAHRMRDSLPINLPIAIYGQVIDLMSRKCVRDIVDVIKQSEDRFGREIGLVLFDTYAKGIAAGGGDESLAKDQNTALANLRRVLDKKNIHIATIGHTGKDETRGERGSNAKLADVDLQVQISGDSIKAATVKKANDQQEGLLTSFRLEPFEFGPDEDGDPFRTFILSSEIVSNATVIERPLTDQQQRATEALAEVTLSHGVDLPPRDGMPAGLKSVTADQWRAELYRRGVLDQATKNPRARFFELRNRLAAKHLIGVQDELVWLATKERQ